MSSEQRAMNSKRAKFGLLTATVQTLAGDRKSSVRFAPRSLRFLSELCGKKSLPLGPRKLLCNT